VRRWLATAVAVAGMGTAVALVPPDPSALTRFASWTARPLLLPFAWQGLLEAERAGDPGEAFARAQQLMRLVPQWSDGFAAFAYRYVLADHAAAALDDAARGRRAHDRLRLAMAWIESARPHAGRHEPTLLQALAFLPEVAARNEPALAEVLRPEGGAAAIADRWFAEAERLFPSAAAREQRTFFAPPLAAALLAAGRRDGALGVLRTAIDRSRDVREQQLAAEWRERLQEVVRWLDGDRTVDLTAVRADARLEALLPHLR
jgi:hypothetical protein